MKDVQSQPDRRNIYLQRVGIKGLLYPITVMDRQKGFQDTVATINMYVDLPVQFRGTHMSRFVEVLNKYHLGIDPRVLGELLEELRKKLKAKTAVVEIEFPYFMTKKAPVTNAEGFVSYTCRIFGQKTEEGCDFTFSVGVPVMTLCPCSKEISDRGAHNQRAVAWVHVKSKRLIWFEELIQIAEESASAPVFTVLKRPDEKFLTEHAYDNPRFVEDLAREIALRLKSDKRIEWYKVEVESFESIHTHNAYACVISEKEDFSNDDTSLG
ncbi:GTP cyclohydrolase FolE2 [Pseudothermotoga thermarum]|uniref:GTP cyclohydrolase FolE2 n=1 Tax=Pseudothermotoga thermarum DSM 5069 TaxID=688269 RepID=F7YU57_9THEM|nr:GTP cyclohydrolase FolE2 [Pseudothermotoga thermarum]AEH50153.1 GTP cyclohydrolase I [Pseudothermotoga thermarum DSM 5069]